MSLVGTTVTLTINDETSTIDITGEIVEKYTGIVSSFRDEIINQIGVKKSVKTKYSVDYYLLKLTDGSVRHILCSDVVKIT
tara:strand:+ start:883 stop:1125 length:243 start_codon:yes stop_codon:yes gene_type:complete